MHLDIKETPELTMLLLSSKFTVDEFRCMLIEVDDFEVRRKKHAMVLTIYESVGERAEQIIALLRLGSVQVIVGKSPVYDVKPVTFYAFNKKRINNDEPLKLDCLGIELGLIT